jgi:hypothetical protein
MISVAVLLALTACEPTATGTVASKEPFLVGSGGNVSMHYQLHLTNGKTVDVSESVYNSCAVGNIFDGTKCTG